MLPAIYFIFSRRGCDKAVADLGSVSLVNRERQSSCGGRLTIFWRNPEAALDKFRLSTVVLLPMQGYCLLGGTGGRIIQQGLIKVVFATETLAGINMPARTTVISSLSKRTDRGHRLLNASEFLQMAGRAGRRGWINRAMW